MTEKRVRNIAEHYVAQRECTQTMLRDVLERRLTKRLRSLDAEAAQAEKEEAAALIETEIARLVEKGLIDDRRFAEMKIRSALAGGKGRRRIKMDLARKGVDEETFEAAFCESARESHGIFAQSDVDDRDLQADVEWEAALNLARKKRIGPFRMEPMPEDRESSARIWRREAGALARAGFDVDITRRILELDPEEV